MRAFRRKWVVATVAVLVAIGLTIIGAHLRPHPKREGSPAHKPEAPPDLQKLRDRYLAGLSAIHDNDGDKAASTLGAFSFHGRVVEEYRLYYLGRAFELKNDHGSARRVYAELWHRNPRAVIADDAAQRLAAFYAEAGDFDSAIQFEQRAIKSAREETWAINDPGRRRAAYERQLAHYQRRLAAYKRHQPWRSILD